MLSFALLSTPALFALRPLREVLIWLLRLDQPVPQRSDDEIAAEVARNYRWNFAVNLLDGVFFWFGFSFMSSATILPLFISKLTSNPLAFALLAMLAQGGWFLPQLLTANWVERLPRKKPVVVNLGLFLERLPVWFMVVAALMAGRWPLPALVLFFCSFAWHGLGAGAVATSWQDMIARCFPVERRGRFFGVTMFAGAGTGALGAGVSTWLLKAYPFPTSFVYCFLIAAVGIGVSWFFLALTREPAQLTNVPRQGIAQYLAGLPSLLRADHNFRRFLIARLLMALGGMGSGFVTVSAVYRWQIPDGTAGVYTAIYLAGQTAGNLLFGLLADRFGHKVCLELGALAAVLGFGMAWLAPVPAWYLLVFGVLGIVASAVMVPGILVVLEFSEPERRPTYIGITNTGVGIAGMVAPLLGAALASISYGWLFALGAVVNLVVWVLLHWWVREPRWENSGSR